MRYRVAGRGRGIPRTQAGIHMDVATKERLDAFARASPDYLNRSHVAEVAILRFLDAEGAPTALHAPTDHADDTAPE